MGLDLATLLDLRFYLALDLDPAGRVLAGGDDTGSSQLIEIEPDGTATPLTALPGPCSGRYVPGQRAVLVSHDEGGNERAQISLLRLPRPHPAGPADLEPVVHDSRYLHTLADVRDGRLCYLTNRRNNVDSTRSSGTWPTGQSASCRSGTTGSARPPCHPTDAGWR